jgi:hypothetical protein
MPSVFKSLSDRRESARRERRLWRVINDAPTTMRNELIEMRDRKIHGLYR